MKPHQKFGIVGNTDYVPTFAWTCPHCGRHWATEGHKTGFVKRAHWAHVASCKDRTPAQRRKVNAADEARWTKNPPASAIYNNPNHPGLLEAP